MIAYLVLLCILGLAPSALSQAQRTTDQAPQELEPMVITATLTPTPLSRTTASVTLISREQIAAQKAESVTDLLRQIPGMHIDQPGARGSISSIYLRGGDPSFTQVLIDGIKVNDPTNNRGGSFDFSTLNTDHIERIEIVRGPLSAVHGSDALSGVINIITREGGETRTADAQVVGGRYGHVRTLGETRGRLGELDYALSGSYLDNGEPIEGSEFINKTFQANIGLPLTDSIELRGVWRYADTHSETFPDASGGPDLAVLREVAERDTQELTLGLTLAHEVFSWWTYDFKFSLYNRQEESISPGVAPGPGSMFGFPASESDATFQRYELTLRHQFAAIKGMQFAAGAQAQFEEGDSEGSLAFIGPTDFDVSRDTWAPFFEIQLSLLPGLLVQGGVRVDLPEGFDTEVSPRVGVSYTIAATNTTLRANWGEGFKVPSFFSLSDPTVGNPNLKPETSRSIDAGVTQSLWDNRFTVSATYFYNRFDDLIDFDTATLRLLNRDEVTTQGVELSLRVQPWSVLDFTAHMTYLDTDIEDSSAELRNRPKWRGGFAILWRPLPALDIHVSTLFVGESLDFAIPVEPNGERDLDDYSRTDLAVTWTVVPKVQLFVKVDNLFDADYEEAIGFPAPGINPSGGIRARF
ncbi:MAG: TonB-dependent receptor [Candidatus Tectomicrobia bacterium]|nr:TonB-dependent receptor [Candidatus Tectomicrobia bacterium]